MPRRVVCHWNTFFLAVHCLSCPPPRTQSQFSLLPFSGTASCPCPLRSLSFSLLAEIKRSLTGLGREPFPSGMRPTGVSAQGLLWALYRGLVFTVPLIGPHLISQGRHSACLSTGQWDDSACAPIWLPLPFCPVRSSSLLCQGPAALFTFLDSSGVWHCVGMSHCLRDALSFPSVPLQSVCLLGSILGHLATCLILSDALWH